MSVVFLSFSDASCVTFLAHSARGSSAALRNDAPDFAVLGAQAGGYQESFCGGDPLELGRPVLGGEMSAHEPALQLV